jgi:hypothetical protein
MADTITVKQLVDKVGIEGRTLRRILWSQFPRETKGKAWQWQPDDPLIELILKAVKNGYKANGKTQVTKPKGVKNTKNIPVKKPTSIIC